jgi:hypothetical protein
MRSSSRALACLAGISVSVLVVGVTLPSEASGTASRSQLRSETLVCFNHEGPTAKAARGYVGLTVPRAISKARAAHDSYRVIAQDGRCFNIVSDGSNGRVNFWVLHEKVIKARVF